MPNAGPTTQNTKLVQAIAETTFASDRTGSLGSFTALPIREDSGEFTLTYETHDPRTAKQHKYAKDKEVLGKKSWTLSFTMQIAPTGTAASDGVTAVQSPLGLILATVFGGENLGTGSAALAGWSAAGGDVTTSEGSGFMKGGCAGWVNSSSVYEMRPLKNVSTDTLTTKLAFSGTPSTSDAIYSAASYWPVQDPDGSLQFVTRGLESDDDFVLLGGQLDGMTLALPTDGTLPEITFNFKGVDWLYGDDAAGSGSLTDITPVTYSNFSPITGHAGRFLVQTNGTTAYTGATVHISSVSVDVAHAFMPVPSPSGTNGVLRWLAMRPSDAFASGSFATYFKDYTHFDTRDNRTDKLIWYQVGTTAGDSFAIEIPTTQFTNVQRMNADGIAGVMVEWKARLDGDTTSPTTDAHYAPFRIHKG